MPSLPPPLDFYTVVPCRLVDTRNPAGPAGGPALAGHAERSFTLAGACGVPAAAQVLALNVTVVGPGSGGDLRIFPAGLAAPLASALNFRPGQTRANNAVVGLSAGAVTVRNDAPGPVDLILDVDGYFQ